MKPCGACAIDEVRRGQRLAERGELAPVDAAEAGVEAAPARHAVDVGRDVGRRQRAELLVVERDLLLDEAEDAQAPRRDVDARDVAGVKDGPLLREVLAGRQAGRVVARVAHLVLGFRAEERHGYAH